jgi:hypothetical protein
MHRDSEVSAIAATLSGLLQDETHLERLGGGRNSRVYKVTVSGVEAYIAKVYFRHSEDDRDRLATEFAAFQFLWKSGTKCVPRPVVKHSGDGIGVYEYVDGRAISSAEITEAAIDEAVRFLLQLRQLSRSEDAKQFGHASEACFSIQSIIRNIEFRLQKLYAVHSDSLHEFLSSRFVHEFEQISQWCRQNVSGSSVSFESEIASEDRTLSPSDFGFHNALRARDGRIVFLDFEYFGWDDPAKMVSDFLLHPAMNLNPVLGQRFVDGIASGFPDPAKLMKRVETVYPLFALKWTLILLNEFLPESLQRRGFANDTNLRREDIQLGQLSKANQMLERATRTETSRTHT